MFCALQTPTCNSRWPGSHTFEGLSGLVLLVAQKNWTPVDWELAVMFEEFCSNNSDLNFITFAALCFSDNSCELFSRIKVVLA
jgi:hypothetical protein